MIFNFEPYVGVNKIKFGDTRENIRKNIGLEYKEIIETDQFARNMDVYNFCHIHYNSEDLCEAVEFYGSSILNLNGNEIRLEQYGKIVELFDALDKNIEPVFDNCGFTSYKFGIGVYTSSPEELDEPIESIIIFKRGYYDGLA